MRTKAILHGEVVDGELVEDKMFVGGKKFICDNMICSMAVVTILPIPLYDWLHERWRYDNHSKYRHLFEEWIENITEGQIEGYSKQERRRNVYE